jgi:hypothetical protein
VRFIPDMGPFLSRSGKMLSPLKNGVKGILTTGGVKSSLFWLYGLRFHAAIAMKIDSGRLEIDRILRRLAFDQPTIISLACAPRVSR